MTYSVRVIVPPLERAFTYEVPAPMREHVGFGYRVIVPFGRRETTGFVISEVTEEQEPEPRELKKIQDVVGSHPHFSAEQIEFLTWVGDYYGESLSSVLEVAIPPHVPQKFERLVAVNAGGARESLGSLQRSIIAALEESSQPLPWSLIVRRFKGAAAALKKLEERELIVVTEREIIDQHRGTAHAPSWAKSEVALNDAQQRAVEVISESGKKGEFSPFLLHGVTGSGKTEVYIEVIQELLAQGRGALIIVPEIALTPQLIDRFQARLGDQVAVLHSALQKRVRWDSWRSLMEGRQKVAIGARSAIFAPVKQLGVIVVDEEHDTSYKQSEGLRYNARDLAVVRAKFERCPVVLGSATPSLESYFHAGKKRYRYIRLSERHSSAPPSLIEVVDLSKVKPWEMRSRMIAPALFDAIAETLNRQEQVFILYNRRGFASFLQCGHCETVLECPRCSVSLTYHQRLNALLCHYCNYSLIPPTVCASCGKNTPPDGVEPGSAHGPMVHRGAGTERIYEELRELFPATRMDRLDRDAVADIEEYKKILDRIRSGKTEVLVGTQMIAKGHDLPGVTLVGIVDCDVGLHMPDFRASERIFQLLTQAAGRAGRGEKAGRVILQTRVPLHLSIRTTVEKSYESFAKQELAARKDLFYPPFARILRVVAASEERELPETVLTQYRDHLVRFVETQKLGISVLGPSPAPLERLKTLWRWHLILKSASPADLTRALSALRAMKLRTGKVKVLFDLDPQEMM